MAIEAFLARIGGRSRGWICGRRLRAYGRIGRVMDEFGRHPVPQPGHPDGAAAFRPVGALVVRQTSIIAAIGLFAGIWWLLMSNSHFFGARYGRWKDPYLVIVAGRLRSYWAQRAARGTHLGCK
jgi:hypothetical protein